MINYKDIRFLESTSNLRELLSNKSGRELSLERANHITVCLEQGRSLFEAAQNVGWEIKPLLVYYGMVGFAKAIYLARNFAKLESLPARHGIADVTQSPLIEEMTVRIEKDGTFQRLNDSCSKLEKLIFRNREGTKIRIPRPTADSGSIAQKEIALKDILARIPGLEDLYRKTFRQESGVVYCSPFGLDRHDGDLIEFTVHDPPHFTAMSNLHVTLADLRKRFTFLENWRLRYAAPEKGLTFVNLTKEENSEIPRDVEHHVRHFQLNTQQWIADSASRTAHRVIPISFKKDEFATHCQPIRGGLTAPPIEATCLIEPYHGLSISELSLYYLGAFLLASLVRYRPNVWANAIARRSFPEKPLDDHALALIEEFIDLSLTVFPQATVVAIDEPFS